MTQTFYAPPVGTIFEDTPYGHALIERYKPWLLANRMDVSFTEAIDGELSGADIASRENLPWIAKKTPEHLQSLFTQDTELPMAVPPIGTEINDRNCQEFVLQYPAFDKYINELSDNAHYEYVEKTDFGLARIIAHPPHSVVVPFVEPVEVETTASETKESEETTVTKPIITTMQKILRPEDGYVIRTPEEVEKFKVCLLMHAGNNDFLVACDNDYVLRKSIRKAELLPYTFISVNSDYGDVFITEAELAQAETQQVEAEKAKSLLLPTVELLQNRVRELEKELIHDLIPLKNNVNTLFQLMGEQKPF